ncbi:cation diffusion facilitator family transporter [Rubidibacter lacunae KORDI 51-2]|uniref:Cation diffusion facilitator family transporter n=1 Tax=Rubidibacter lacunae KORDI 51-2 TaxID=582515 RepID=U5D8H7_9CHRO|nr:cation diffusion facilitator family transporter [Rubidibacter lacunae]ERN40918.1 cation diffusion facilitator family transporter [Rubidibacter lacunae KORDI 51-2]
MGDRRARVCQVLVVTLVLNLCVMALKGFVGLLTGSLSLQADALHSVTDSANNVLGLISNSFASPEPDREHPYGHQKFEALGALGIAAFLGIACFEVIQRIVERLVDGASPVQVTGWELWILLGVLGINIFVAFYERHIGQKLDSPILIADARHTMSDVWISIAVIGGLVGIWQGNRLGMSALLWLDVLLAVPVAILVFRSGWGVLRENLPWLVDEIAIAPEAIDAIAMQVPGVINCHDIASRGVLGRQVFVEMHMVVAARDVETAHEITERVEALLEERFGPIRVSIHVEPPAYKSDHIGFGESAH